MSRKHKEQKNKMKKDVQEAQNHIRWRLKTVDSVCHCSLCLELEKDIEDSQHVERICK